MKCKEVDKVIKRRKMRKDNPVYNHSLAECNGFLYDLIKKQERDLKELNDHIDSLRDELNTYLAFFSFYYCLLFHFYYYLKCYFDSIKKI